MNSSSTHAFVNKMLIYVLLMIGVNGFVGLAIVFKNHQIAASADVSKQAETRLAAIERRLDDTSAKLATALSPEILEAKNVEMNLGLVRPLEDRIVRVNESPEERLATKRNLEIFARDTATGSELVRFTLSDPS